MDKTIKTVLAIVGALTALCAALLIVKKLFGCKRCCKKDKGCCCDKPDSVEAFAEEAQDKVEEIKDAVADAADSAEEKAEAIAEEFKDYADVELPNE